MTNFTPQGLTALTAQLNREPLLLRVPRVAFLLGLSRARAYALIANGVIPSIRLGGGRSIRVSALALEQWLRSGGPRSASDGETLAHGPPPGA